MAIVVQSIVDRNVQQCLPVNAQQLAAAVIDIEKTPLAVCHHHAAEVVLRQDLQQLILLLGGGIGGEIACLHKDLLIFLIRRIAKIKFANLRKQRRN